MLVVGCIVPARLLAVANSYFALSVAVLQTLVTSTLMDERDHSRLREHAVEAMKLNAGDKSCCSTPGRRSS